jgi:hypothetical protein
MNSRAAIHVRGIFSSEQQTLHKMGPLIVERLEAAARPESATKWSNPTRLCFKSPLSLALSPEKAGERGLQESLRDQFLSFETKPSRPRQHSRGGARS